MNERWSSTSRSVHSRRVNASPKRQAAVHLHARMAAVHTTAVKGFAAAGHYENVRPDYPAAAIDKIIQHCGLTSSELHLVRAVEFLR